MEDESLFGRIAKKASELNKRYNPLANVAETISGKDNTADRSALLNVLGAGPKAKTLTPEQEERKRREKLLRVR